VDIIPAIPQVAEPFHTPEQAPSRQISKKIQLLATSYVDETARRWRSPRDIGVIGRQIVLNDAHPSFSDDASGLVFLPLNQYFCSPRAAYGRLLRQTRLNASCKFAVACRLRRFLHSPATGPDHIPV